MLRDGRRHDERANTGRYRDGFGNLIDVHAVANPPIERNWKSRLEMGRKKSAGFGIVRVNKAQGTFTLEAWPVGAEKNDQYAGWPIKVAADDTVGTANPQLATVVLENWTDSVLPVVKVTAADGQLVSIARMSEKTFTPRVFDDDGKYTVQILLPQANNSAGKVLKTFKNISVGQTGKLVL